MAEVEKEYHWAWQFSELRIFTFSGIGHNVLDQTTPLRLTSALCSSKNKVEEKRGVWDSRCYPEVSSAKANLPISQQFVFS